MPGPSSAQIRLDVLVDPSVPSGATLVHSATVMAGTVDSLPDNNAATSIPLPVRSPDLWIVKTGPNELPVDREAAYTLRYGNRGPGGAAGVVVTDVLPEGMTHSRSLPPATDLGGGVLAWELGEVTAGDQGMLPVQQ